MFQSFVRNNQITELLKAFPDCRPLSPDRNPLELPLQLPDGRRISLRISLPTGFPKEPPALSLTSHINHPWVDRVCRVNVPSLTNWAPSQRTLLGVVTEAKQALEGPAASGSAGQQGRPYPNGTPSQSAVNANQTVQALPPIPVPSISPYVASLEIEELNKVLVDEQAYATLLARIITDAVAASSDTSPETLKAKNVQLANANLALEKELAEAQNQIAIVRATDYDPAMASYQEMCSRQERVRKLYAPEALTQRLQAAVDSVDAESQDLERKLSRGEMGVEEFVAQYVKVRQVYHQRDLKYKAAQVSIPMDAAPPRN